MRRLWASLVHGDIDVGGVTRHRAMPQVMRHEVYDNFSVIGKVLDIRQSEADDIVKSILVRDSHQDLKLVKLLEIKNNEIEQTKYRYKMLEARVDDAKRMISGFKLSLTTISNNIKSSIRIMEEYNQDIKWIAEAKTSIDELINIMEMSQGSKSLIGPTGLENLMSKEVHKQIESDLIKANERKDTYQLPKEAHFASSDEDEGYVRAERNFLINKSHSYIFHDRLTLKENVKSKRVFTRLRHLRQTNTSRHTSRTDFQRRIDSNRGIVRKF